MKALKCMAGKPMIQHVVERVRQVKSVGKILVATTHGGNGALAAKMDDIGVECFQWVGPESDVLGRFVSAADSFRIVNSDTGELDSVEYVLRVCGDSPLFDPQSADELIYEAWTSKADYTGYKFKDGTPAITKPNGYFGEVIKMSALRRANEWLPENAPEREHVTSCMYSGDQNRFHRPFTTHFVDVPAWYVKEKLKNAAVDTQEDFDRVREVVEKE